MTAQAKKPSAKPALQLVGPDLEQMEAVVLEAAKQQAPIVLRAGSLLDELTLKARDLASERAGYVDRQSLLTRQYEAAMQGLGNHIADIDAALTLLDRGIGTKTEQ